MKIYTLMLRSPQRDSRLRGGTVGTTAFYKINEKIKVTGRSWVSQVWVGRFHGAQICMESDPAHFGLCDACWDWHM